MTHASDHPTPPAPGDTGHPAVPKYAHLGLITPRDTVDQPWAEVDAIVVPTARSAAVLDNAMSLASTLGCPLLVLCSRKAAAPAVIELARVKNVRAVAVDVTVDVRLPRFETSAIVARHRLSRGADTSVKRNVALAVARMTRWQRIMFLDDDITIDEVDHVRAAARLTDDFDAVGLHNAGFPDNSVVFHAHREVGDDRGTFIGGGAMVVPMIRTTSFFPDIYNEDWFFLLEEEAICDVAVTGFATQKAYDPYADLTRARGEEFGDCLAEGLFDLLERGDSVQDADEPYWAGVLHRRRESIGEVLGRLHEGQAQIGAALRAARDRLDEDITPALCVDYVQAWLADRKVWQDTVRTWQERPYTLSEALEELGLHAHRHGAF